MKTLKMLLLSTLMISGTAFCTSAANSNEDVKAIFKLMQDCKCFTVEQGEKQMEAIRLKFGLRNISSNSTEDKAKISALLTIRDTQGNTIIEVVEKEIADNPNENTDFCKFAREKLLEELEKQNKQ